MSDKSQLFPIEGSLFLYMNQAACTRHQSFIFQKSKREGQGKEIARGKGRGDKTRQDKTRQDKTRQDKTRQDKTRQDKTRQDQNYIRKEKTERPKIQEGDD